MPVISKIDLLVNGALAAVMATVFVALGGKPLASTFVPALVVAFGLVARLHARQAAVPEAPQLYPLFYGSLAWQVVHFAEEWATDFHVRFPALFGAEAFSPGLFVGFNLASYVVFAASCHLAVGRGKRGLLMPVVFFMVYGALGNAISHTWWVFSSGDYFPGFYSAQAYWVLGPLMVARLMGSVRAAACTAAVLAAVLLPLLAWHTVT